MKTRKWNCRLLAITNDYNGHKLKVDRHFEGAGDIINAAIDIMDSKKNAFKFYGVEITIFTPLGQKASFVYEPKGVDREKELAHCAYKYRVS